MNLKTYKLFSSVFLIFQKMFGWEDFIMIIAFLYTVCWHLLPSDSSCFWTPGDRAGQTRQECLKWGSRANQETDSCVQHGLSKSFELLLKEPWWIYVLLDSVLCLHRAVYLTLRSGVVSFRMSLAKRWHWLLTDSNPPHRKHKALKCEATWQSWSDLERKMH